MRGKQSVRKDVWYIGGRKRKGRIKIKKDKEERDF